MNNNESIPTGAYRNVSGTAYDFTTPRRLGERIAQVWPRTAYFMTIFACRVQALAIMDVELGKCIYMQTM